MASIHIVQVLLVLGVLGVAVVNRFVIANPPPGRAGMMVFGVVCLSHPEYTLLGILLCSNR